ncbi:ribosylglycohydrolase [Mycobacterium antarcticum]|uniref:ADP-ribosylglycohydrolase family protein n=1 Tax=Mycolicibacterium sp. TUM20983 TaxID=3023369 RepID=UPI0023856E1A|nr:ADP-ribosylglycohydrolase family protein [Mycolicibacterium sp. TUM20983]GLP73828.1 ribosylglycohydrolase [Mycolicibacterium sp. TUM20983]
MTSTTAQVDRACGVLLGTAAGDALGAPYEFQPARGPEKTVAMVGGGAFGWEPGEWTDDTSMAIAIAEVAAAGADLRDESAQDAIVERWYGWSRASKDVGIQTRSVLDYVGTQRGWSLPARYAALQMHERSGRTGGNGALMRTAPVALAYLHDEDALVTAAREISALTHYEPDAGEACVLWCCAIRHAVLTGELDVRVGLSHLDAKSRDTWSRRLEVAEASSPAEIENNGWVVAALQAAWSAIHTTNTGQGLPAEHLTRGLDAAVRAGDDTDTVAAIAGGLLGAAYGASAVPSAWRRLLHGWPGLRARDLVALTNRIIRADCDFPRPEGPAIAKRHPYDDDVWLGNASALLAPPVGVDAIVSLCRVHDDDLPDGVEQIDVRLIDREGAEANQNLDFVLSDTVDLIYRLRREGRIVLVHCHGAHSRTPTVGALYGARVGTVSADEALADVLGTLPTANPNPGFRAALKRLAPRGLPR